MNRTSYLCAEQQSIYQTEMKDYIQRNTSMCSLSIKCFFNTTFIPRCRLDNELNTKLQFTCNES